MYNFTGCECAICHQHFKTDSDIVVCPDCGTPYHRDCYQMLGHCKHQAEHNETFAWQPPKMAETPTLIQCSRCGAQNNKADAYCKHCGLSLEFDAQAPNVASSFERKPDGTVQTKTHMPDDIFNAVKESEQAYLNSLNKNETFAGVPLAEWLAYLGKRKTSYLATFKLMQLRKRKYSFSFSAMLFGPLYFFYRKAWSWALIFTLIAAVLNIPAFLTVLVYSESAYAPALSQDVLFTISQIASILSWVVMMLRGLYGTYLYQISAANSIKKITARAKSDTEKWLMLKLYGGTSWPAVILAMTAAVLFANGCAALMGPEFDAMLELLYY